MSNRDVWNAIQRAREVLRDADAGPWRNDVDAILVDAQELCVGLEETVRLWNERRAAVRMSAGEAGDGE